MASESISFLIPIHTPQVHCFLGTCEAHHPTHFSSGYETIKMIIFMSPAHYARKHTRLSLVVGGKTHDWVFVRLVVATAAAIVMVVGIFVCAFKVVVVVVACEIFFACFVIDSTFVAGDPGHELAQYA